MIQSLLRSMELLEVLKEKKPQFLNRGTGGGDGSAPEHGSPDSADIL